MAILLSIFTPTYNRAYILPKCIESVLNQTFFDFELLLIDDGSKDNTLEICNEYHRKDIRVKVYAHQNKGVSYTRNRGIEEAAGELIIFIDGDDYIKEDYIETLLPAYEEVNWPICGMINVRNNQQKNNENFAKLLQQFPTGVIERENFLDLLKFSSLSSPCARIYSKSIINRHKISFDENLTYQEDLLFNLEYSQHLNNAALINYFGYYYVEHQNSSTGRFHKYFDHIDLLANNLKKMVRTGADERVVKEFVFQTVLRKVANLFHPDAQINKHQKMQELKKIFCSKSFLYADSYIFNSDINFFLKCLLKIKNPYLLYLYYRKLHT